MSNKRNFAHISASPAASAKPAAKQISPARQRLQTKSLEVFTLNDPVHGLIEIDDLCKKIIDTPEFQRLDYLKQLGVSSYVFRSANHTRFSHSVGVYHLASRLVNVLKEKQPELGITDADVLCVKIAGLCHDLGHGPFSHVFDGMFIKIIYPDGIDSKGNKWRHEDGSVMMLNFLLESNNIIIADYNLTDIDKLFVEEIISGVSESKRKGRPYEKFYLYDIVNNTRSGLDVDKLDYFQRDMMFANIGSSKCCFDRFIEFARVVESDPLMCDDVSSQRSRPRMICYPEKLRSEALDLFRVRFDMHEKVYAHKTTKKLELMVRDALVLANDYIVIAGRKTRSHPNGMYKISECIYDIKALSKLDDRVLYVIMCDQRPELAPARRLLERIDHRDLYSLVGETGYSSTGGDGVSSMKEGDIALEIAAISKELTRSTPFFPDGENSLLARASSLPLSPPSHLNFKSFDTYGDADDGLFSGISEEVSKLSYVYPSTDSMPLLCSDDLVIEKMHLHYGLKDQDPVSKLRFFPKVPAGSSVPLELLRGVEMGAYPCKKPQAYEDKRIRVFARDSAKAFVARLAFDEWCRRSDTFSPFPIFSQSQTEAYSQRRRPQISSSDYDSEERYGSYFASDDAMEYSKLC